MIAAFLALQKSHSLAGTRATNATTIGAQTGIRWIACQGDNLVILLHAHKVNDVRIQKVVSGLTGFQSSTNTPIAFRKIKLRKLQ